MKDRGISDAQDRINSVEKDLYRAMTVDEVIADVKQGLEELFKRKEGEMHESE